MSLNLMACRKSYRKHLYIRMLMFYLKLYKIYKFYKSIIKDKRKILLEANWKYKEEAIRNILLKPICILK